jgi:hypothetical protein
MPTGYELKTEGFSTVVNGKEFDLSKSRRLSSMQTSDGGVTAMYQDEGGEYFMYSFTPRKDGIIRVDQNQAVKIAAILNQDGKFDSERMHELVDAGIFTGKEFDFGLGPDEEHDEDGVAGIPDALIDRHRELAAKHHMSLEDWLIQCLEQTAAAS